MSTPRVALVALLLSLLATSATATAIVVFRTPDRVILASDSMQQSTDGQRTQVCKVRQAGRWWSTISGYTSSSHPALDVQGLVTQAVTPARTLAAVKDVLVAQVEPRVRAALERARHEPGFRQLFTPGTWVAAIVLAGTDVDDPTLRVGLLVFVLDATEPFRLTASWLACPGRLCPEGSLYFGASVDTQGPTVQLLAEPRAAWVQRGDSAAAHRVISSQIAATPTLVSAPIDIVELTAHRAQWVKRDPSSTCSLVHP